MVSPSQTPPQSIENSAVIMALFPRRCEAMKKFTKRTFNSANPSNTGFLRFQQSCKATGMKTFTFVPVLCNGGRLPDVIVTAITKDEARKLAWAALTQEHKDDFEYFDWVDTQDC